MMGVPFGRECQAGITHGFQKNQTLKCDPALMGHQRRGKLIPPYTSCSYKIDCTDIIDLRTDINCVAWGIDPSDIGCDWRSSLASGCEPPSWHIARRLISEGHAGLLVRSFASGATEADQNLVLWKWSGRLPHLVKVFDPTGRLPKNQLSWD